MIKYIYVVLILVVSTNFQAQVSPEIELGAKGVMSGNLGVNSANAASAVSDFSDSQLLLGFREKLYNNWRAQMVFGLQFPDADSDLGQVFYNHVFLKLQDQKNIIKVGRSTTQTILNEFSTLRDDDAMKFNYVLNPFSDGVNTEDNQYGNVIEYSHIFKQRYRIKLHGENFTNLASPNNFELNSFGGSFVYAIPVAQKWNRNIIQRIGISYNNYITNQIGYTGFNALLKNVLGTVTLNIKPDPVHFIDLKVQGIYNVGFQSIDSLNSYSDYTAATSVSIFGMLRYMYRKYERPLLQTSFGFGYKSFSNIVGSEQIMGISNLFYRVGESFDIGFQYRYLLNKKQSETLFGKQEHRFQLALIYTINEIFNNQFDKRNSILNLEHNYLR